ncbi:MAG: 6-phospho-3-hexuloisomerase [Planctomycetaceae bacterium]|nr:6-phospho-3-hexuloisomerase [Planctomycetaceae bacterium]
MGLKTGLDIILHELGMLYDQVDDADMARFTSRMADAAGTLFVAGAGRSGLLLRCFAMRMMHMGRAVHMVGDITTPAARPGDLLLIGSGSGETAGLAAMATKAKGLGLTVLLITTSRDSTIGRLADDCLVLPAPTPKASGAATATSVQPMGNLFEQAMFLFCEAMVMQMMQTGGLTSEKMFERHANLE